MRKTTSFKDLFNEYYYNNKGGLYKSFEININNHHNSYDIYWGDPNIIFDKKALEKIFPLAVTVISRKKSTPNPRIFLHEKLNKNNTNPFENIIAHEIGHIWLHDIVGFNHPMTNSSMKEYESEIWADYFAYCFFRKYRKINSLAEFNKILAETSNLHIEIYHLAPKYYIENEYIKKKKDLSTLEEKVKMGLRNNNSVIIQMDNAIEITLNSLGDVFK